MIIDKQAFFTVRMAKNIERKSDEERRQILADLHPKARILVNQALAIFADKRRKEHGK